MINNSLLLKLKLIKEKMMQQTARLSQKKIKTHLMKNAHAHPKS